MESKVSYSRHMDLHSGMGFLTAFQALRRGASYGLDYHVALIYGCLVAPHEDAGYAHVAVKNSERCAWPTVWLGACVTCCLVDFMTKPVFQRKPWDEIKATK